MGSAPILERAVKRSGSRISVGTLRQRLEVEVAPDADVLTIRVVDSTARGAAQLADGWRPPTKLSLPNSCARDSAQQWANSRTR